MSGTGIEHCTTKLFPMLEKNQFSVFKCIVGFGKIPLKLVSNLVGNAPCSTSI